MNYAFAFTAIPVFVLLGVVFLLAPTLHRGLVFGHTVETGFLASSEGRVILGRYRLLQVSLFVLMAAAYLFVQSSVGPTMPWPLPVFVILYAFAGSAVWVWAYRRTRSHAIRVPLARTASLAPTHRLEMIHLAAFLPVALTSLVLAFAWPHIPARFPIHWNAAGIANGWAHRTPVVVFGPLLIPAGIVTFLWLMLRYATPGPSRIRWLLPALAWCLSAISSVVALLPLRANTSTALPGVLLFLPSAAILGVCAIAIAASLRHPRNTAQGDGTPDSRWIGGILYYNPQDPALWVEKRFGIGWTLNFARPASWLMIGAILLVVLAGPVLAWLAHH